MAGDAEFGAAAGLRAAVVEQTARINQLTTAVTDLRCTLITCLVGGCALFFVLLLSECFSPKASEFAHLCGRNFGAW
jgi:hypothetical protein